MSSLAVAQTGRNPSDQWFFRGCQLQKGLQEFGYVQAEPVLHFVSA